MTQTIQNNKLEKVILAVDNMTQVEVKELLKNWPSKNLPTIKIGLELFLKYGQGLILELFKEFRVKIFLDLKFYHFV